MAELFSTFGVGTVLIILLIGIPAIVNFITWCKGVWKKRASFAQENYNHGRQDEAQLESKENRLQNHEAELAALKANLAALTTINTNQQRQIDLLIESDKLSIKAWIKEQHEKWTRCGYIDSQSLEVLEDRFKVYTKEDGNSWAEKLMNEIRALPLVTVFQNNNRGE